MRFIPTYPSKIKTLKKQAKRLQREGAGTHVSLLDKVAQSASYDHWHHVLSCVDETARVQSARGLIAEIEAVIDAERSGQVRVVQTGPEATRKLPFVLFSTGTGDVWLLEPANGRALCLVWRDERQAVQINDLPTRLEIMWSGTFELRGEFFVVETDHPEIRSRAIAGFPLEKLRPLIDATRPIDRKIEEIFEQEDTVPLTTDVAARLVNSGWNKTQLEAAARQGARYSPRRDSLLFPPVIEE